MKVLIVGGAGYIGSHVNRYVSKMGWDTVVLDDLSRGHEEAVVAGRLIKGSVHDGALLDAVLETEKPDAAMHFAAFADVAESVADPGIYYRNNVGGLCSLLEALARHGVRDVVFSSTAATFGEPRYVPIDEEHPQFPINPYGRTKLACEGMLADFAAAYGMKSCVLRYFNAAGASVDGLIGESHDPEHHLIPNVLRSLLSGGAALRVNGLDYPTRDGSCLRDYIHVDDLADAHLRGLELIRDTGESAAFNMGSGEGSTVLEIVSACEKVTGRAVKYTEAPRRPGDPASLVASNARVRAALGWQPRHGIEDIIAHAWQWEQNKRF